MKKEKLYTKFGARFEYQAIEHMANNYSYNLSPIGPSFIDWIEYIINIPIFVIKEVIYKIETRERKSNRPYERYITPNKKSDNKDTQKEKKSNCTDIEVREEAQEYDDYYNDYLEDIEKKYGSDVEDVIETDEGYYLFYKTKPRFIQRYNENTTKTIHIGEDKDNETKCECFYKRRGYFLTYGDFVVLDLDKKKNLWKIMMLPSRKVKYISMEKMVKIYCRIYRIKPNDMRYLATDREKAKDDGSKGEFHKW